MSFTEAPFYHYVIMGIGWPSFFLYIMVIVAIVKNRMRQPMFRSPFYTMILAQSIPCILLFLYLELILRPRRYGFYKIFEPQLNSRLVQCVYFGHQWLRAVVIFSFVPFAANRLLAVSRPERYSQLWTTGVTAACVLTYWSASAIIVAPTLFMPYANFSYVPNKAVNGLDVVTDVRTDYQNGTASLCIFAVSFACCLVLYVCTFAYIISIKIKVNYELARNMTRSRSNELLLLLSSFLMFSTLIFDAGDNVVRVAATLSGDSKMLAFAYDFWYVTTETMCISPPWSLLIASPLMRRDVISLLRVFSIFNAASVDNSSRR